MFKSHHLPVLCFVLFSSMTHGQDSSVPMAEQVRGAISRAIPMLEAGSIGSANKRQCFTCHSQAVPVFALVEAKRQGFAVDNENIKRQLKHTHEHLKRGLENYRQGKGQGGDVLTAGYALWTLDVGDWPHDEVTDAVSHYLLEVQSDLQHWRHRGSRPPSSGSDFTATYVALRGLQHFGSQEEKSKEMERRKSVTEWLINQSPAETEDSVFRLNALMEYTDASHEVIEHAMADLVHKQRDDGGWGQMDEMTSDAYATGTAIAALSTYHHVSDISAEANNASMRKGIAYLLSTQQEDGTWHVVTRAKPVQEYFESDFPHGKDQFISIAATAWSTIALLQTLSPNNNEDSILDESKPIEESKPVVSDISEADRLIEGFLAKHQVPGASVAITNASKILYSKGFGFADVESNSQVTPSSLFRIASLSKPITAVAILQLVELGKLKLEDKVFSILGFSPEIEAAGQAFDARLRDITIEQLLQHRGGWDRDKSFDPMFQSVRFAKEQRKPSPASQRDVIVSMLSQRLDFEPGERFAYSNFGYCLLGRVIEKLSDESYEPYVQSHVLKPLGVTKMCIGATRVEGRAADEVRYYAKGKSKSVFQTDLGEEVLPPYGAWNLEAMDSHGGWIASAEDLVRFAVAFDDWDHCPILSRSSIERMHSVPSVSPGKDAYYTFGWNNRMNASGNANYWHTGSLPGTLAIMIRRRDGSDMVALLNTRDSQSSSKLEQGLDELMHKVADAVKQSEQAK
ncbi:MAG: serine hydrolase [Planctomycetota bacterium]|nr:serine hydrolase [Planctomycetota bacterium]